MLLSSGSKGPIWRQMLVTANHDWKIEGSSPANAIVFSADGKLFATANVDHTVGLYRSSDGRQLILLQGHTDAVRTVAFSPDGKRLASGSWDRTVRVWDVDSRKLVCEIGSNKDPVNAVAFSRDGQFLAIGTGDWRTKNPGEVSLWDPITGRSVMPLLSTRRDIKALAFSPDGHRLASACGSSEGSVAVLTLSVGAEEATVGPVDRLDCPSGATALAYSPDGKILAAGQWNGKLCLWDAITIKPLTDGPIAAHDDTIFDLAFSPDGTQIATSSKDNLVKIWDLKELVKPRSVARKN